MHDRRLQAIAESPAALRALNPGYVRNMIGRFEPKAVNWFG